MKNVIYRLAFACTILFISCQRQPLITVIAQVGDSKLTLEEARANIDTTRTPIEDQLRRYIMHWVNQELLYQEAKQRSIENTELFKQKLQQTTRLLMNQYFLDQYIYSDSMEVNEQAMQEYFRNHSSEFIVRNDVLKLNIITFNSRERASLFASSVLRGTSWVAAVTAILHDTIAASSVVSNSIATYYTQHTLFPIELWKVAATMDKNDISFPVKTTFGFSILQMTASMKKGAIPDYSYVRDEVRERILVKNRRMRYNELLENLRLKYKVEIFLNSTSTSDSDRIIQHE